MVVEGLVSLESFLVAESSLQSDGLELGLELKARHCRRRSVVFP